MARRRPPCFCASADVQRSGGHRFTVIRLVQTWSGGVEPRSGRAVEVHQAGLASSKQLHLARQQATDNIHVSMSRSARATSMPPLEKHLSLDLWSYLPDPPPTPSSGKGNNGVPILGTILALYDSSRQRLALYSHSTHFRHNAFKSDVFITIYAYVAVPGSSAALSPANNDKQGGSRHGANAVVDRQTKNPSVVALDAEEEEGEAVDISGTRKRAKRTKAFVCDYFTKKIEKQ
jgi:hypothetical protein